MSDETKTCSVCAESIKAAAIECRFCNSDLAAYSVAKEAETEKTLFTGHPAVIYSVWQWVAVIFSLGVAYICYWMQSISTTYQITTKRVRIERGFLFTLKENIELFRVDHFDLHRPLGMRLAGHCLLHPRPSDTSVPTVMIFGIPNLESLADTLRECSLRERKRRQVTTFVHA